MPDYVIKMSVPAPDGAEVSPVTRERLVRAKNMPRAIAHVVKDSVTAVSATTEDVMRMARVGIELEQAE